MWNDAAKVVTISNKDVTDDYKHGAIVTLKILKKYQCDTVILKQIAHHVDHKRYMMGILQEIRKRV